MMKQTTINSCTINSNNIYDNTSGIDFKKVYSDYTPLTIQDTVNFYLNVRFNKKTELSMIIV